MRMHENDVEDDVPALSFRSEDRDSDNEEDELDDDSVDQPIQYYSVHPGLDITAFQQTRVYQLQSQKAQTPHGCCGAL